MENPENPPYYFKCPQCRRNDAFHTVGHEEHTLRNVGLFFFGGLDSYALFSKRSGPQIQCKHCGHVFLQPKAPNTRESKLIALFWALFIVLSLALVVFYIEPNLSPAVHTIAAWLVGVFMWFYDAYPAATIITLLFIIIGSIFASGVYDGIHRKKALANFRIDPPPYHPRQD